jgi:hypothetical protein
VTRARPRITSTTSVNPPIIIAPLLHLLARALCSTRG